MPERVVPDGAGSVWMLLEAGGPGLDWLPGCTVHGWRGIEMALVEDRGDGRPAFSDPRVPYLQCDVLEVDLGGAGVLRFEAPLVDDVWQLAVMRALHPQLSCAEAGREGSIFRTRHLHELPTGRIEGIHLAAPTRAGQAPLRLRIDRRWVHLSAGEIHEQADGGLDIHIGDDESVLLWTTSAGWWGWAAGIAGLRRRLVQARACVPRTRSRDT